MQIGVYGAGYLGTVISACLADFGTPVTCCHPDSSRMVEMAQGKVPFHEKNLAEVIQAVTSALAGWPIRPMSSPLRAKQESFFWPKTAAASVRSGAANLESRHQAADSLDCYARIGWHRGRTRAETQRSRPQAIIVSQPVFFTAGCAVEDFNWPDRIVLGTTSNDAVSGIKQIFHPLVMRGVPVIVTSHATAELVRESATAFVATKISFINELAGLCEKVNGDAVHLSLALGLDKKIGPRCLQAGAGMGGLFAQSDMDSLANLAQQNDVSTQSPERGARSEPFVGRWACRKDFRMPAVPENKDIGILGLAFKPNTNSVAGSASISLAQGLVARGARVRAYDPVAIPDAKLELNGTVHYCESPYAVAEGVEALIVGTGWPEFRALDFAKIKNLLRRPLIVDTKNILDSVRLRAMGFEYVGVGRV